MDVVAHAVASAATQSVSGTRTVPESAWRGVRRPSAAFVICYALAMQRIAQCGGHREANRGNGGRTVRPQRGDPGLEQVGTGVVETEIRHRVISGVEPLAAAMPRSPRAAGRHYREKRA